MTTLFNQAHIAGSANTAILATGVGGTIDGVIRQYGAYNEEGLVAMPESLSFKEASTLPCAALTAWNALFGLGGKGLKAGETVLTQGTGGVSLFAVQVGLLLFYSLYDFASFYGKRKMSGLAVRGRMC